MVVAIHTDAGRENDVIDFLHIHSHFAIVNKQLKVADFAICEDDNIVVAFERKTWRDLSDTIKSADRSANNQKLIDLKSAVRCNVFYIIEGKVPRDTSRGVPIKNMRSYLDARIFRDGFHVEYTRNHEETAQLLVRMAGYFHDHPTQGESAVGGNSALLYQAKAKEPQVIYEQMWLNLPGVTAANYPSLHLSFAQFFNYTETEAQIYIRQLRYSSGRILGNKVAEKISTNIDNREGHIKLLTAVPRITPEKADIILKEFNIKELISGQFDITDLRIKDKRFGPRLNEHLHEILSYDQKRPYDKKRIAGNPRRNEGEESVKSE